MNPRLFSVIGNVYSDAILQVAGLAPVKWTSLLGDAEIDRLYSATQKTLRVWIDRLRKRTDDHFPEKVTAFRKEMPVHGCYGELCPECSTPVQQIVYTENEIDCCPRCQTHGKILADRVLSRLLKKAWSNTIDELKMKRGL